MFQIGNQGLPNQTNRWNTYFNQYSEASKSFQKFWKSFSERCVAKATEKLRDRASSLEGTGNLILCLIILWESKCVSRSSKFNIFFFFQSPKSHLFLSKCFKDRAIGKCFALSLCFWDEDFLPLSFPGPQSDSEMKLIRKKIFFK